MAGYGFASNPPSTAPTDLPTAATAVSLVPPPRSARDTRGGWFLVSIANEESGGSASDSKDFSVIIVSQHDAPWLQRSYQKH
jgi:hypothetical protein